MNTQDQVQNSQDRAKDGVRYMSDRAEKAVEKGGDMVQNALDRASEIKNNMQEASAGVVESAQHSAQAAYDTLVEEGKKTTTRIEKDIKSSPFTAVGLAFLGGVVLTSLLKR